MVDIKECCRCGLSTGLSIFGDPPGFLVSNLLLTGVMIPASDSSGQHNAGGGSNQGQRQYLYGLHAYAQYSGDKSVDGVDVDNASVERFGSFASVPESSGNAHLIIPVQSAESDIGEPGGYVQWSQISIPTQNVVSHCPAEVSSVENEYSFSVEEFGQNPNQGFEADLTHDCQFSNFKERSPTGHASNLNANVVPVEYQPLDPGFGILSTPLPLSCSANSLNGFQTRVDSFPTPQTEPWPSTHNMSLPSELNLRRLRRKSNVSAVPMHEQPRDYLCDRCSRAFNRASDLRRHYNVHFPDHRTFHCFVEGCDRSGERGFYRRDKLHDHQRQAHRFQWTKDFVLLRRVRGGRNA
jgi:hypothetical protein